MVVQMLVIFTQYNAVLFMDQPQILVLMEYLLSAS